MVGIHSILSDLRDRRSRARRRIEKVFSRDVLGSILVSLAIGKVIETTLKLFTPGVYSRLVGWLTLAVAFVLMFAYWERVSRVAEDVAEKGSEAVEDAGGKD